EDQGDAVAVAVALADKLDTLVGFWAIDEKPTGSGDPYQLRRAALGVIRIVLENDLRLPICDVATKAAHQIRVLEPPAAQSSAAVVQLKGNSVMMRVTRKFGDEGRQADQIAIDLLS